MRKTPRKEDTPMVSALEIIQKYFAGRSGGGGTFSAEERLHVLNTWFIKGRSPIETKKYTGIALDTLYDWMKSDWWRDSLRAVKQEKQEQLDGGYTKILEQTLGVQSDRLENGDAKIVRKTIISEEGVREDSFEVMRYPMKGKDAAVIGSIAYQNRALLRGDPTSRTESISTEQLLDKIADRLAKVGEEKKSVAEEEAVSRILEQVEQSVEEGNREV